MSENKLSIEMIPEAIRKKEKKYTHKKLGLIKKNKTIPKTFRLRIETNDMLSELTEKIKKKLKIDKMNRTQVIELLIMDAYENPNRLLDIVRN